jgi:hypothetical protein
MGLSPGAARGSVPPRRSTRTTSPQKRRRRGPRMPTPQTIRMSAPMAPAAKGPAAVIARRGSWSRARCSARRSSRAHSGSPAGAESRPGAFGLPAWDRSSAARSCPLMSQNSQRNGHPRDTARRVCARREIHEVEPRNLRQRQVRAGIAVGESSRGTNESGSSSAPTSRRRTWVGFGKSSGAVLGPAPPTTVRRPRARSPLHNRRHGSGLDQHARYEPGVGPSQVVVLQERDVQVAEPQFLPLRKVSRHGGEPKRRHRCLLADEREALFGAPVPPRRTRLQKESAHVPLLLPGRHAPVTPW